MNIHYPRYLGARSLSLATPEALFGSLNFAQSTTFNKLPMGMFKSLYAKLYAKIYCPARSPVTVRALLWRRIILTRLPARHLRARLPYPNSVRFTDSSTEENPMRSKLNAILFREATLRRASRMIIYLPAPRRSRKCRFLIRQLSSLRWNYAPQLPPFSRCAITWRPTPLLATWIITPPCRPL